jgi:hypothetical protein
VHLLLICKVARISILLQMHLLGSPITEGSGDSGIADWPTNKAIASVGV